MPSSDCSLAAAAGRRTAHLQNRRPGCDSFQASAAGTLFESRRPARPGVWRAGLRWRSGTASGRDGWRGEGNRTVRQLLRLLVKRQPAVVVHKPDCEHHIAAPPARAVAQRRCRQGQHDLVKCPLPPRSGQVSPSSLHTGAPSEPLQPSRPEVASSIQRTGHTDLYRGLARHSVTPSKVLPRSYTRGVAPQPHRPEASLSCLLPRRTGAQWASETSRCATGWRARP